MKCSAPHTYTISQFRKQYAANLKVKTAAKQVQPNPNNITAHRWQKGQSGNYAGRPKKYTTQLVECGYNQSTIYDCISTLLATNETQLRNIQQAPEATILERTIAAALIRSYERGNLYALEALLSRRYGKPKETADITQSVSGEIVISMELT